MNIHCLGDSITAANNLPESGRWTIRLQMLLEDWQADQHDVYINGIGGDTTAMGMERMKHADWDNGLTIIEFGFNDAACRQFALKPRVSKAEYVANLRAMGEQVRQRGGEPVYLINHTTNFVDEPPQADGKLYTAKVAEYGEACRELAQDMDAAIIDLPQLIAERQIAPEDYYIDGIHLNVSGNRHYAEMVFSVIKPLIIKRQAQD